MRNIVAIFAFVQCCYAETVINSAEEFQHFVYETGWRTNAEYCTNHDKDKWYNDKVYKDSIYKVIPQAIADCMQRKAEFENVGEIVTFKANDYTKYSDENWNAVVLWNYLYFAIYKGESLSNEGVEAVGEKLKAHYKNEYDVAIDKAVSDIQTYAKDLNLYDYIRETKENTKNNKFYAITKEFDTSSKNAEITLKVCNKTIYIQNGKVSEEVAKQHTVPTSVNQIHALPNFAHIFNEKHIDISANKCWFNSVMLNLYNSKTFHKVINELQAKSHDKTMPSYWIKQIFNDIRTGDMSHYGDHLRGLIEGMKLLKILTGEVDNSKQEDCEVALTRILKSITQEGKKWHADLTPYIFPTCERIFQCVRGCKANKIDVKADIVVMDGCINLKEAYEMRREVTYARCLICDKDEKNTETRKNGKPPVLLVFHTPLDDQTDSRLQGAECLDTLILTKDSAQYKYKLIGVTEKEGGYHYIAKINIGSKGWYKISDIGDTEPKKINFDRQNQKRKLIFYERIQ